MVESIPDITDICTVCNSNNDVKFIRASEIETDNGTGHLILCKRCREILKNKL